MARQDFQSPDSRMAVIESKIKHIEEIDIVDFKKDIKGIYKAINLLSRNVYIGMGITIAVMAIVQVIVGLKIL